MSIRSTIWAVTVMMALSSAMVACGHKDESKTKIQKAALGPAKVDTSKENKDGTKTESTTGQESPDLTGEAPAPGEGDATEDGKGSEAETAQNPPVENPEASSQPVPAQDTCAMPFLDLGLPQNEREIKFADFANPAMLQLGAEWKDKEVGFELTELRVWAESGDIDQAKKDQVLGVYSANENLAKVECQTIRPDRAEGDQVRVEVGALNSFDLVSGKAHTILALGLQAGGKTAVATPQIKNVENILVKDITLKAPAAGQIESLVTRMGSDIVIMRTKTTALSTDGKFKNEVRTMAVYRAYDLSQLEEQGEEAHGLAEAAKAVTEAK